MNDANCARCQVEYFGNLGERVAHEHDGGGLHGNIGAGAHGDAEIGLSESGSIVDAIADHGDARTGVLQALHKLRFFLGKNLGAITIGRDGIGNPLSSGFGISGDEEDGNTLPLQARDEGHGFAAQAIAKGSQTAQLAVPAEEGNGLALGFPVLSLGFGFGRGDNSLLCQQAAIANEDVVA